VFGSTKQYRHHGLHFQRNAVRAARESPRHTISIWHSAALCVRDASSLNSFVHLLRWLYGRYRSLILEHLRHVRTAVDALREDMREVKSRLGHLEEQVASSHAQYASLSRCIDRLDERLERVERRLALFE
jgi:hypothetical protein